LGARNESPFRPGIADTCPREFHRSQWTPARDTSRPADDIPVDLENSLAQLYCTVDPQVIREMKSGTENDMVRYHHGLGTRLRNTWDLWTGSRLSRHLNGLGLKHPDDISAAIPTSGIRLPLIYT